MEERKMEVKDRILKEIKKPGYKAKKVRQLAKDLRIGQDQFLRELEILRREGLIYVTPKKLVMLPEQAGLLCCSVCKVLEKGAFVKELDRDHEYYVYGKNRATAMLGDIVWVKKNGRQGKLEEVEILDVLKRSEHEFSGVITHIGETTYIEPQSKGSRDLILTDTSLYGDLKDGERVSAKMNGYTNKDGGVSTAEITGVFGSSEQSLAAIRSILYVNHVAESFPDDVLKEAREQHRRGIQPADLQGREDLTESCVFTIDGANTKDIDDAVSIEKTENGYKLGVHIADVSVYVPSKSKLDREAFERATSLYFADSVIPMLPKELSNGICSLNPKENRLSLSAFLWIDHTGKTYRTEFKKTVIRSRVKGVYEEINQILRGEGIPALTEKYREVLESILMMRELYVKLRKKRYARGALKIETSEAILEIKDHITVDVRRRDTGEAENMIEEFMLCANQAAASLALQHELPFVYRVHGQPSPDKISAFLEAAEALGYRADAKREADYGGAALSKIVKGTGNPANERVLSVLLLRSMQKAVYSPVCSGHFGLALKEYCHFTSPIRRYPDLVVHRILSDWIMKGSSGEIRKRYEAFTKNASIHASEMEIRAMEIERSVDACCKAEYMKNHLNEEFEGVISSVTPYGVYVELENTVEGFVRIADLPGNGYEFHEKILTLIEIGGKGAYRIGEPIRVMAVRASVSTGQIDFIPV